MRRTALALALGAMIATPGCLKLKDRTIVLPDGSGKIEMRVGFPNSSMKEMHKVSEEESFDLAAEQLKQMRRDWKGFSAFTRPVKSEDGGWTYVTFDAYFDDLNAVQVWKEDLTTEERVLQKSFELEAIEGGGFDLTFRHQTLVDITAKFAKQADERSGDMSEEDRRTAKVLTDAMRLAFDGLALDFAVEMPGDVTRATGFSNTTTGSAALHVTLDDLLDEKKVKKLAEVKELTVRCGPSNWKKSDIEDFKEELADAKAEWKKLLAEVEAKEKSDKVPAGAGGGK